VLLRTDFAKLSRELIERPMARTFSLQRQREGSVADVYITDELRRPTPKITCRRSSRFRIWRAACGQPEEVLPCFVDLAMEMTGGVSAGPSFYEANRLPACSAGCYLRAFLRRSRRRRRPRWTGSLRWTADDGDLRVRTAATDHGNGRDHSPAGELVPAKFLLLHGGEELYFRSANRFAFFCLT
jgi:hypothetical protein